MISLSPPAKVARVHKGLVKLGNILLIKKLKGKILIINRKLFNNVYFLL